jgi:DNA-binding response OmpR family regulator
LLLSADEALAELVAASVQPPWALAHQQSSARNHEAFTQPNVRLVLLDDETVDDNDRGMLLRHLRRYFPSIPLLYVAGDHDDENERRARTNGAHYYAAKPLALDRFSHVLQSFLRAHK